VPIGDVGSPAASWREAGRPQDPPRVLTIPDRDRVASRSAGKWLRVVDPPCVDGLTNPKFLNGRAPGFFGTGVGRRMVAVHRPDLQTSLPAVDEGPAPNASPANNSNHESRLHNEVHLHGFGLRIRPEADRATHPCPGPSESASGWLARGPRFPARVTIGGYGLETAPRRGTVTAAENCLLADRALTPASRGPHRLVRNTKTPFALPP
jgi:hypothetical protein